MLITSPVIKQHKMRKAPILAVGNKIDLETRQVEIAEAKEILMEKGVVDVMECSAKGSLNTKEVFDRAVQLVVSTGPVPTYTPKSKCALL